MQNFPVITHKINVTGENQEIEDKIRNYTLSEIQTFLKDFTQREGERGTNWLLRVLLVCLFDCLEWGLNCYSRLPKWVNRLASLKTLNSRTFLKNHPGYMLIASEIPQILSPLSFPLKWGRTKKLASQAMPAAKWKADAVMEDSSEEEEVNGKAKTPIATDICTRTLPLLTWTFIAWHCAHPSITVITARARGAQKTLRWSPAPAAHDWQDARGLWLPWPQGPKRRPPHFQLWGGPIWPWVPRVILYSVLLLIIGWH